MDKEFSDEEVIALKQTLRAMAAHLEKKERQHVEMLRKVDRLFYKDWPPIPDWPPYVRDVPLARTCGKGPYHVLVGGKGLCGNSVPPGLAPPRGEWVPIGLTSIRCDEFMKLDMACFQCRQRLPRFYWEAFHGMKERPNW